MRQETVEAAGEDAFSPISIYPNPANDQLMITFTSITEGRVQIQARSLNGQVVINRTREIGKGENTIMLDGLSLPDGLYFLQLFTGDALQSAKFIIQKN